VRAPADGVCCAPLAREPLSQGGADELAPLFKAVADPMRLRLLSLIACHDGGESCVCDLTAAFGVTAPTISYHLKILREAGLISAERRGTWVYYRINPQVMARMSAVLVPQPATSGMSADTGSGAASVQEDSVPPLTVVAPDSLPGPDDAESRHFVQP
jgi:ArsR family transcriptional regulator, arsenate/arsenite/antimonite-responsive transcriptional repressor